MVAESENVGVAFALVIGAGASTAIGASVVFFPSLVKLASRKTLAGGLGLSAGVMSYVSFVEIFQKSVRSFEDAGYTYDHSYIYATLCFFGGVVSMILMNAMVHNLLGFKHDDQGVVDVTQDVSGSEANINNNATDDEEEKMEDDEDDNMLCPCCAQDPGAQLEHMQDMAEAMEHKEAEAEDAVAATATTGNDIVAEETKDDVDGRDQTETEAEKKERLNRQETRKLTRMSLNTAVAIGLHNFPEGLATFVAALNDPKVGAVLAVAIAIHNIPEGLCVAMPVYYATGNRWRAFWWAVLSGLSEPVAAVFGYIILASSFSDSMYAVLFGVVAGMMIIISVRELLPTAHRYDPDDTVVTFSFIAGMMIMALSLVLFLV